MGVMDRWLVLEVAGAGCLVAGVRLEWGLSWALMAAGVLLLVPVGVRAWRARG